ncbi:PA0069 family radical SAM protein [Synoicihabitans lomoniglobus]|uniref:PA0069 family radical SAM protein n=1 Tax=Synoicihabitans lomoniglobus TaxID=2909285 RepID=A0AAE9ZXR6_9BACT|nr:PA0069 family radical SAM protein [Opitutaceae bacterium LMO-M01]WED64885.1 PA0069 family radical SAM protein [Opitutaceae bacterium LMO-M01]
MPPSSDPSPDPLRRHVGRGRGSTINPANRFVPVKLAVDPDAWSDNEDPAELPAPTTQFFDDDSASILSRNDSPDVPFTFGVNPYRGCEHGCAYCYARAYHDYLGWSSGLDFETKILVKRRAPELLRAELSKPTWQPTAIAFSGATDCYQPCERRFQLTRQCLEVALELRNPVGIVTKNRLVTRDLDLLRDFARWEGVNVLITLTSLDPDLARKLEPRAASPTTRLDTMRQLADAGIPVGVMIAPIIPGLTDHEIPSLLQAAADAGATAANRIVLRLPHTVKDLFTDWLDTHAPTKKARVLSRVRELRGGELNVSQWRTRMRGEGPHADNLHRLFEVARRRAGLVPSLPEPNVSAFRRPGGTQLDLL